MPRRPSILAGLTLATLATIPRTASAQRERADFDALAVRITAGEASARKELMPIARRMMR